MLDCMGFSLHSDCYLPVAKVQPRGRSQNVQENLNSINTTCNQGFYWMLWWAVMAAVWQDVPVPLHIRLHLGDPSVAHGHLFYNPSIKPAAIPMLLCRPFYPSVSKGKCSKRYPDHISKLPEMASFWYNWAAAQLQSCRLQPLKLCKAESRPLSTQVFSSLGLRPTAQSSRS